MKIVVSLPIESMDKVMKRRFLTLAFAIWNQTFIRVIAIVKTGLSGIGSGFFFKQSNFFFVSNVQDVSNECSNDENN